MKKLFLAMMLVLAMVGMANAQTWYTANQETVAWDAVAPIATGDTIKYQVYTRQDTTSAGVMVGTETTETQLTISFPAEGRYYIGVETVRYPAGETAGMRSETKAWSNVAADCATAGPFGIKYFVNPGATKNLRDVP